MELVAAAVLGLLVLMLLGGLLGVFYTITSKRGGSTTRDADADR